MLPRDLEQGIIRQMRAKYAQEFALAEDTLNLGNRIFVQRRQALPHPQGDPPLGQIVYGLIIKILNVFWAIIILSERALPASSTVRELAEAVVSLEYLLKEDSVERARLYWDHIAIRDLKDMNRRLDDPKSKDLVIPEVRERVEENIRGMIARRSKDQVEKMKKWPTYGGNFSFEAMIKKTDIEPPLYTLLYAIESRAPHALDISSHAAITPTGTLVAQLPAHADRHLVSSTQLVLIALRSGAQAFTLSHESEFEAILARVLTVSGVDQDPSAVGPPP
jgi:hypothetical protein